jgi:hypothetical protein
MNILKTINELREERERVEQAILVLERIASGRGKRRGQPPAWMSSIKKFGRPKGSKNKPKQQQDGITVVEILVDEVNDAYQNACMGRHPGLCRFCCVVARRPGGVYGKSCFQLYQAALPPVVRVLSIALAAT